jgi:hypothetical protein
MPEVRERLCGPSEIAALHAVKKVTAYRWNDRGRLSPPTWTVSSHAVWSLDAVVRWSRQEGKYQRALDRWAEYLDAKGLPMEDLTFTALYDLLQLGQAVTRVEEIGTPAERVPSSASASTRPGAVRGSGGRGGARPRGEKARA